MIISALLAVDAAGAAYFAGFSVYSPDFPTSRGAFRTKYGGGYVGKLSPDGARLLYSTYLGTNQSDGVSQLMVDANGRAPDADQPCLPGQATGFHSAFVAKFDESGSKLSYSTFATGVPAMDPNGMYYFTPGTTALLNKMPVIGDTKPALRCVVNGASYRQGPIAPGEIITLVGTGIGPDQGIGAQLDDNGRVATTLGGVQVWIGGIAAPLLYVSKNQVNAAVPFEVEGRESVAIEVRRESLALPFSARVTKSHPATFTLDSSGYGAAAVMNQDGTINSEANPAAQGSVISLFVTGLGAMAPPLANGSIPSSPVSRPLAPVTMTMGGNPSPMELTYIGNAPSLVAGAIQINATIPVLFQTGQVIIQISAGDVVMDNTPFVTVWVK